MTTRRVLAFGSLRDALVSLVIAFGGLAVFVAFRPLPPAIATKFDQRIRVYPGGWRFDLVSAVRGAGSEPAVIAVALAGALLLWRCWHRGDLAVLCIAAPLLAGLSEVAVKILIERSVSKDASLMGAFGYGFPSGHTASTTALAAVVVIAALELATDPRVRRRWMAGAAVFASAVAVSNVASGAHHGLDVVGGVILGVIAALASALAISAWTRARGVSGGFVASR